MIVRKKQTILVILILGIVFLFLPSCSAKEKGSMQNQEKKVDTPDRPQHLQKDKIHTFGEVVSLAEPTNQDPGRIGAEYTVRAAKFFDNYKEAEIDENQLIKDGEVHYDLNTESPSDFDISDAGFLLCDITVKNIKSESMNITSITLVCMEEDGNELKMVGFPAYFDKPDEVKDKRDYYNFYLPAGQSMDAKVGWWVDLQQCKKENLYLVYNYGGDQEFQQYWELNL